MKYFFRIDKFLLETLIPVFTVIIVGGLISFYNNQFITTDPMPKNIFIIPKEVSSLATFFTPIKTGFILSNIPTVDANNNRFAVEGFIWFKYDPSHVSLKSIGEFSFLNGTIEYKSQPSIEAKGHLLFVRYKVKVSFSSKLDYQKFPFDDHRIYFVLTNVFFDPDQSFYVAQKADFVVAKDISIPGWKLSGDDVFFGRTAEVPESKGLEDSYPEVVFVLKLEKNSLGTVFTIIIPLLIMFFIALASIMQASALGNYSKKGFNWDNYSVSIGNLAAILAYRFVIESVSPKVGYLTVSDVLYIFVLGSTVISLVIPFAAVYLPHTIMRRISSILIMALNLFLVFLIYYFLFVKV
jgi:hypothetical protein